MSGDWLIPAFLLSLALLGAIGAAWWLRWAVKRQSSGTAEPVCGACRYPVRGLSRLECPECGADLREAGIISPGLDARFAPGIPSLLAGWTVALVLSGTLLSILGSSLLPEHAVFTHTYRFTVPSGSLRAVDGVLKGSTYDGSRRPDTISVTLTAEDGTQASAAFSGTELAGASEALARVAREAGIGHAELANDLADVQSWLTDVGPDGVLSTQPARLAGGLMASSTRTSMPLIFLIAVVAISAVLWAYGSWRLVRLRRRALAPSPRPVRRAAV